MSSGPGYVLWFDDPRNDLATVGGKGTNLSRLTRAGFPVPRGFCVTTAAYRAFMESATTGPTLQGDLDALATGEAAVAAARIRRLIEDAAVPPAVASAIADAYAAMNGGAARVAVRSSATAEDLPDASFAGQQDTYLGVQSAEAVLAHVRRCWASLWTDRAVAYRAARSIDHASVALAVVVQVMVDADVAGVLFTVHPVSLQPGEMVINASYGLGEAVVSGEVEPDTYVVDAATGAIRQRDVGRKAVAVVADPDGTVRREETSPVRRREACLGTTQIAGLVDLGARVAAHFDAPQDIEWALQGDHVFLLQSRPVTTDDHIPDADPQDHWTRGLFVEILPDAPSPLFCSVLAPVLKRMLDYTFVHLGQRPPGQIPAVKVFYHQPYFNLRYIRAALDGLPRDTRERMTARMANPFEEHAPDGRPGPAELRLAARMLLAARRIPGQLPATLDRYYQALERAEEGSAELDDAELADRVVRIALEELPRLVEVDFLLIAALGFCEQLVDRMVRRAELRDEGATRGALMSGITGNVTMETNKELWQLAVRARRHPEVAALVEDDPSADVLDAIGDVPGGSAFLAALDAFLERRGHREVRMDIAAPTWNEDPSPVLGFIRSYLSAEPSADPALHEQAAAHARSVAADEVEQALGGSLAGRLVYRPLFKRALHQAELLGRDRETMHFHWTAAFPVLRRMIATLGERWRDAGLISEPDDVFCLTMDELQALPAAPRPMHDVVSERRLEWQRDQRREWPREIVGGKAMYPKPDFAPLDGDVLAGIPGSPGVATGPARVLHGPEDFDRLKAGDVLVARLTNPVWTPLFAVASALVTDTGGVLSHGAIVAREYGIPAVLGVRGATSELRDGDWVTVDGSKGMVARAYRASDGDL